MTNKKLFMFLVFLLVMPIIFATETTINVKTLPNHYIQVKILDPFPGEGNKNILEYFNGTTDEAGSISFKSYSNEVQVNIIVIVMKNGERVEIDGKTVHEFNKKITGGVINLEVKEKPAVVEIEINESEVEEVIEEIIEEPETEIIEESIEENPDEVKLTGLLIGKGKKIITSKTTYYFIGGIFILGALFFMILLAKKKIKSKRDSYIDFKIRPYKKFKEEDYDQRILNVEKKIKEAEKELEEISGKRKQLREVRERFERDKKELDRLEKE